jgi:outer membrane protein OmpA-like peptidoglycan-associated protein
MKTNNLPRLRAALTLAAVASLAACASAPTSNAKLDEARAVYTQAAKDPLVARSAQLELQRAQQALGRADAALRAGDDVAAVEHQAYLARQQANIALQAGEIARADQAVVQSQAQRDRILLEARTRDAEAARKLAEERLAMTQTSRQKADKLQAELRQLKAKQTDRGMVLTLGDVLFDSGRAELKPGAMRTIDRLAVFMRENPERRLNIEGYTDSVGSDDFNLSLSQRRADAVRAALVYRGVDGARIDSRGFGEAGPVASNNTAAGRQRNRRIEIVISPAG